MRERTELARRRKTRARPTPKWLLEEKNLDQVAQTRCLLVLSVLSGETPVTEAIRAAGVSRGTYYQLETRALNGMLRALLPGAREDGGDPRPRRQIAELESKLAKLERARRRSERLLALSRRLSKGRVVSARRSRTSSTTPGRSLSPSSTKASPSKPSTPSGAAEL